MRPVRNRIPPTVSAIEREDSMALNLRPMKPSDGRRRVVVEELTPQVDGGRYPAKRVIGDAVEVRAAVFADGHDHVAARLLFRHESDTDFASTPMQPLGNDVFSATFTTDRLGTWLFSVEGWIDHFDTWYSDLQKRIDGQPDPLHPAPGATPQNIPLALRSGAILLEETAARGGGEDAEIIAQMAESLRWLADQDAPHYEFPLSTDTLGLVARYPDLSRSTRYPIDLPIWCDRERARFSSWYELFPRSASPRPLEHGTLADVEAMLPSIAEMGFDVLYLPPIHPIGKAFRKGPNNNVVAVEGDHGSPWAIGAPDGGHKAVHAQLGTLADLERLARACKQRDIDLAMDIAFQCSPDHPWVQEHPDWFIVRPDGSIQYAENPPKKYQDIYPLNFESSDWRGLWEELLSVFLFWIRREVTVFRVDNPHTKALPFWEWCVGQVHRDHPEVIFLAEAFTRPHVMYSLAKAGYTQSYTYFTWRTTSAELRQYLEEITRPPISDFFRPNFWPNTPDILHAVLQQGGRPAFMQRVILAATLSANYGIYGPAYELLENLPLKPGSEEYRNSEKYEIRAWDRSASFSILPLIQKLNAIRKANKALQTNERLVFHDVDNPNLLCYSKTTADHANTILVAINLDYTQEQAGWIDLDLKALDQPHGESFDVEDLLTGVHYTWRDRSNYVALRPDVMPAHVFRLRSQP